MAQERHEFTGKSVDEAIAEGLKTLRVRSNQVTIEVLHKGSRGIFGLGSEPAQVRLTLLPEKPAQPVATPPPPPEPSAIVVAEPEHSSVAEAAEELIDEEITATVGVSSASASPESAQEADVTPSLNLEDVDLERSAREMLTQVVALMGFQAHVQATWKAGDDEVDEHEGPYLLLNVKGGELGVLIGRKGETLDSLQYLLRLMVNQRFHRWTNIIVDVDGYKERRATQLHQLALRTATQVAQSGRSVSLEPMPANERRIIHMVLRDHPDVYTESSGDGDRRKVHIIAKD